MMAHYAPNPEKMRAQAALAHTYTMDKTPCADSTSGFTARWICLNCGAEMNTPRGNLPCPGRRP